MQYNKSGSDYVIVVLRGNPKPFFEFYLSINVRIRTKLYIPSTNLLLFLFKATFMDQRKPNTRFFFAWTTEKLESLGEGICESVRSYSYRYLAQY
jgi:hypothetical protein